MKALAEYIVKDSFIIDVKKDLMKMEGYDLIADVISSIESSEWFFKREDDTLSVHLELNEILSDQFIFEGTLSGEGYREYEEFDFDEEDLIERGYLNREASNPEAWVDIAGQGGFEDDSAYPDFFSAVEALIKNLHEANEFKACGRKSVRFDLCVKVDIEYDGVSFYDYTIEIIED